MGSFYRSTGLSIDFSNALFFDHNGYCLLPDPSTGYKVSSEASLKYLDKHMPHILLSAVGQRMNERETQAWSTIPQDKQIRIHFNEGSQLQDGDKKDQDYADCCEMMGDLARSLFKTVQVSINYEAYDTLESIDFTDIDDIPAAIETLLGRSVDLLATFISDLRAKGGHPLLLRIRFKPEKSAFQRVFTGTPIWAKQWAKCLRDGEVLVVLDEDEHFSCSVSKMKSVFDANGKGPTPFDQWFTRPSQYNFSIKDIKITTSHKGPFSFYSKDVFSSKLEYMVVMAVSILANQRYDATEIDAFCAESHQLQLIENKFMDDRRYRGYLPVPTDFDYRLQPGIPVEIRFQHHGIDSEEYWPAQVASGLVSIGPDNFIPLIVRRSRDNATGEYDTAKVEVVDTRRGTLTDTSAISKSMAMNEVRIIINPSQKIYNNLLRAIKELGTQRKNNSYVRWNRAINTAILCSRLDLLEPHDIFAAVRDQFPQIQQTMELNAVQHLAVEQAKQAPGGLQIVQGPPGTGKSQILREYVKPFMRSKNIFPVLIISSSNAAVDDITNRTHQQLVILQQSGIVPKNRYVLRVHSMYSEKALWGFSGKTRKAAHPRKIVSPPKRHSRIEKLKKVKQHILELCRNEDATDDIADERIVLPQYSAARMMLEVTGVIQGSRTHPESNKFAIFRKLYTGYLARKLFAEGMTDVELEDTSENSFEHTFEEQLKRAWEYTLQNASVIVTTTTNAGLDRVIGAVKDHVRLLMLDEAAHEKETNLLPFFAAPLVNLDGFVQVGDLLQLQPVVRISTEQNVYANQDKTSFMARLIAAGFEYIMLTEQYRMLPEISAIANALTYNGRLVDYPIRGHDQCAMADKFQNMLQKYSSKAKNVAVIDIPKSAANHTRRDDKNSRYNDLFIILIGGMMRTLVKLDEKASVGVLTSYNAQKERLLRARANMIAAGHKDLERVSVETIDGAQGKQYDFVIVDILVDNREPRLWFSGDPHRINVALTRARNGLLIYTCVDAIHGCRRGYHAKFTLGLLMHLSDRRIEEKSYDDFPDCKFYRPDRTSLDRLRYYE